MVSHLNLCDSGSGQGSIGRKKAVHLTIETDVFKDLALIGFQSAAIVVEMNSCHFGNEVIGYPGRKLTADFGVLAILAPATDNIIAFAYFVQQTRNINGIILKVSIHED